MRDPLLAREARTAWLFLAPFLALLAVFFGYAALRTLWFSFTSYDLFTPPSFAGLANYRDIVTEPLFGHALRNSLLFSAVVTVAKTILALLLASFVNRMTVARGLVRTVFYVPSVVSSTVMTLIFLWLFSRQGLVTQGANWTANHWRQVLLFALVLAAAQAALVLLARRRYRDVRPLDPLFLVWALMAAMAAAWLVGRFLPTGDRSEPISWLNTRATVLWMPVTLWSIALINVFTTIPVLMLLYLAGLQSIPTALYEAAELDGVPKWRQLTRITVPLLAPVTFGVVTLSIVGTLQMFDQVAIMGDAAPIESRVTLAYYTYYNTFPPGGAPRIGMASAGAVVLAILTLLIVYLQRRLGVSDKVN